MKEKLKIPKSLPKVGNLYKVRGDNLSVLEDTLQVWKEVGPDEYVEHHFSPDDPTTIFLTEIVEIPGKNIPITEDYDDKDFFDKNIEDSMRFHNIGTKHSFIFLIDNKKIATTPFYMPMFDIFFEKQSAKRRKKI